MQEDDSRCFAYSKQYWSDFSSGRLPIPIEGVRFECIKNDGSREWKELHDRAAKGAVFSARRILSAPACRPAAGPPDGFAGRITCLRRRGGSSFLPGPGEPVWCFLFGGSDGAVGLSLFFAGHSDGREDIVYPVVGDQVRPLGAQPDEVRAVLATVPADASVDTKEVRVGAVGTLAERDADFGHRYPAFRADHEQVLADPVVITAGEGRVVFEETVDAATHEEMRGTLCVGFDLLEALVDPVDAITAIYHFPASLACGALPTPA